MLEIDKRFELIQAQFIQNNASTAMINKAYELAKFLHKDQRRLDGGLYISHPVEVALILAQLGFDENVISAALLHDVVEDCGYTLEKITQEFNVSVAEMVDCVSVIDEAKFVFNEDDLYEDVNFAKASIEEQSFKKLIGIGKKNPLGFCIKFADRLHNMRTIGVFDYSKQLEKVKETEKWIIPIAKILHTEYFYRALKNECFKITHRYDGKEFFEHYNYYHNSNLTNIQNMQIKLQEIFSNTPVKSIKIKNVREYKVYEDLQNLFKNINITKTSQGQILKVTNYNIYILYENKYSNDVVGEVLNILNKQLKDVKIIDARIGNFTNKPYYQLEDRFKNKFNLYIESLAEYIKQRNGTLDGLDSDMIDDDNLDSLDVELIRVITRSGEVKFIPKGSTVLDFAFKIHRDVGFGFKYAIVNNSKTKFPPYTKVYEGDKIEIVLDKKSSGEIKNNAELKWLAYVNTDLAKKYLIKYFEKCIKT
ncbi:MAG: HD domain-containing protein [Clostridia bacterium]|nr:HD domain-containing protein [Clostridia bacterium]